MSGSIAIVVLAAGQGKRMRSDLPKVMFPIGGLPALTYPLEAARAVRPARIVVVVGHQAGTVQDAFSGRGLEFVVQEEQLGTGHAVLVTQTLLGSFEGAILVLYGDGPLLRGATLARLAEVHFGNGNDGTLLTCEREDPTGYGRIIRDSSGAFRDIREERDCDEATRRIKEVYSGIGIYAAPALFDRLARIGDNNAQHEYYLTDLPGVILQDGGRIGTLLHPDPEELEGFNSREQYEAVCRTFEARRGGG